MHVVARAIATMLPKSSVDASAASDVDGDTRVPLESYVNELGPRPQASVVATRSDEQTSAAHRLVRALVEAGVDTFFGIPGGPVSPVFDAILRVEGARLIESR